MILDLFIIIVFILIISIIIVVNIANVHSQIQQNKLDFIDELIKRDLDPSEFFKV